MVEETVTRLLELLHREEKILQEEKIEVDELSQLSGEINTLLADLNELLNSPAPGADNLGEDLPRLQEKIEEVASMRRNNLKMAEKRLAELGQTYHQASRGRKALGRYKSYGVSEAVFLDSNK